MEKIDDALKCSMCFSPMPTCSNPNANPPNHIGTHWSCHGCGALVCESCMPSMLQNRGDECATCWDSHYKPGWLIRTACRAPLSEREARFKYLNADTQADLIKATKEFLSLETPVIDERN